MSLEQAKSYVTNQLSSLKPKYDTAEIHFMGGEPLLEFSTIKGVAEWLWKADLGKYVDRMFASTNGTLLNEEMKKWFTANRSRIVLGLSFDGDNMMQDINRTASHESVDIGFFAKTWPNQSVKMTLTPGTLPNFFEGVMYLEHKGFHYIRPDLAMGNNVIWTKNDIRVYAEQLDKFVDYYVSNPEKNIIPLLDIDFNLIGTPSLGKKCGCGESLVCIDTDGKEYACHLFSPISSSKAVDMNSDVIDFKNHARFISYVCSKCVLVNICNHCCGMNYLCNNDVAAQDSFTCVTFRVQFFAACRLWYTKSIAEHDEKKIKLISNLLENINFKNYEYT